ncbi:hypothetical protein KSD_42000 [Ktedonobacter sp. SOSP1-85]|uniref:hypothetical protein n=1 Tax=Ktedonobacter sp. SOSP1-85 TaxID=2778367 RepID=UPI00191620CB|nr:hypothetical protein [Ktedonobacter sp. SOSP1-85]GHO76429.1 hypothetical protein KSD_42000 [Ktedonobacter sp. SOSP1-85]
MREPAFNTIALMLTVYVAALVWGIQHVCDRYTPNLLVTFFRRIALLPLITLVILLCIAGSLLFPMAPPIFASFPSWVGDVLSFGLLVVSIVVTIATVYRMMHCLAKGTPIIAWFRKRKGQVVILEDILLNVIQHNDVRLTHEVLNATLHGRTENRQAMIDWLEYHRTLLSINWVAKELIGVILSSPLDDEAAHAYYDLLGIILSEALDKEEIAYAQFILDAFCDALDKAQPWTKAHMNLLTHIGFTLWKIGDPGAWMPRTARIPEQLKNLQWWFYSRVNRTWNHVLRLKDVDAVNYFVLVLCELIRETTGTKDLCGFFLSQVYDVLADAYPEHLFNAEALKNLVNELGHLRLELPDTYDEDTQKEMDSYMLASLAILAELGETENALRHAAGNGYLRGRIIKGKWLGTYRFKSEPDYFYWLSPSSYTAARRVLGLPRLSRKQADELIERKAMSTPITIQDDLDLVTDEASHPSLGSSPEAPILLKVHRSKDS